ncbi:helix-turn-helix domain-containing protein [Lewinella sp. W8]|uniref:helix-turn-helix domain-containing protein n=1 Tax=Lewinella sp. W8 TaxID=2528208 RepID=UPI0010676724|nr:helix-turn-helix domain-containing protein [Lewinella sp. W8]MTB50067.1 helix-turn-helix domain-containing protein [Lewinella sp. W8]
MLTNTVTTITVSPEELLDALEERLQDKRSQAFGPILKRLQFVTVDQVATMAQVSPQTVRNWTKEGILTEARKGCKERYLLSRVLDFIAARDDRKHKHSK